MYRLRHMVSFYPWSCRFVRPWFCIRLSLRKIEVRRIFAFSARQQPHGEAWFRRKTSQKVEIVA
jgi:hypothetical protein